MNLVKIYLKVKEAKPEWILVAEGHRRKLDLGQIVDLDVDILVEFQIIRNSTVDVEEEEPQCAGHNE